MNASHIIGKKKNRFNRCRKRLTDKELPTDQRSRVSQRMAELQLELK